MWNWNIKAHLWKYEFYHIEQVLVILIIVVVNYLLKKNIFTKLKQNIWFKSCVWRASCKAIYPAWSVTCSRHIFFKAFGYIFNQSQFLKWVMWVVALINICQLCLKNVFYCLLLQTGRHDLYRTALHFSLLHNLDDFLHFWLQKEGLLQGTIQTRKGIISNVSLKSQNAWNTK